MKQRTKAEQSCVPLQSKAECPAKPRINQESWDRMDIFSEFTMNQTHKKGRTSIPLQSSTPIIHISEGSFLHPPKGTAKMVKPFINNHLKLSHMFRKSKGNFTYS